MTTNHPRDKKVDRAFEVIEGLEKSDKKEAAAGKSAPKGPAPITIPKKSGLKIKISLDALISEKDTQTTREKNLHPGISNLLNLDFTVPYIWRIPIVGKTALKVVKYVQKEQRPESIRDILKAFRKKPL